MPRESDAHADTPNQILSGTVAGSGANVRYPQRKAARLPMSLRSRGPISGRLVESVFRCSGYHGSGTLSSQDGEASCGDCCHNSTTSRASGVGLHRPQDATEYFSWFYQSQKPREVALTLQILAMSWTASRWSERRRPTRWLGFRSYRSPEGRRATWRWPTSGLVSHCQSAPVEQVFSPAAWQPLSVSLRQPI